MEAQDYLDRSKYIAGLQTVNTNQPIQFFETHTNNAGPFKIHF